MSSVGLVSFYLDRMNLTSLVNLLRSLGCVVHIVEGLSDQRGSLDLATYIQNSSITHWIFSDSEYDVGGTGFPGIPSQLWHNKRLLFICYSMHEALYQLGCVISFRNQYTTGYTTLQNGVQVFRNHHCYVPVDGTNVTILDSLLDACGTSKVMTARHENALFLQWQPEKTPYGHVFFQEFLRR